MLVCFQFTALGQGNLTESRWVCSHGVCHDRILTHLSNVLITAVNAWVIIMEECSQYTFLFVLFCFFYLHKTLTWVLYTVLHITFLW